MAAITSSSTADASSSLNKDKVNEYFATGTHHVLCKIPGLDQPSFPESFQDMWDLNHVRLPCSNRIYPKDISMWPEIVRSLGLDAPPIKTSQQFSETLLRWNKAKAVGWNMHALDAFLNSRSEQEGLLVEGSAFHSGNESLSDGGVDLVDKGKGGGEDSESEIEVDLDQYRPAGQPLEDIQSQEEDTTSANSALKQPQQQQQESPVTPLVSQFLSPSERTRFFEVILPRIQALALRLPELVPKPIPFLRQQVDVAVTLSQEQIACLLANAFLNTFPSRNTPFKKKGYRKKKPQQQQQDQQQQQQEGGDQDEEDEDDEEEEEKASSTRGQKGKGGRGANNDRGGNTRGGSARGGRGGGRGGRGGANHGPPRPSVRRKRDGPAGAFDFFEEDEKQLTGNKTSVDQNNITTKSEHQERRSSLQKGTASSGVALEEDGLSALRENVENLNVKSGNEGKEDKAERRNTRRHDVNDEEAAKDLPEDKPPPRMPSINFISMFWAEEIKNACTSTQAAKLRCILHYFDRVTTSMPTGVVTYHRQVLKKPIYFTSQLEENQHLYHSQPFSFEPVTVDTINPLEVAPLGALQIDFANKNLGGGVLDRGAVQEEIRFMICPELILSRLFTLALEPNEAVIVKGAEQYSNYIGYSRSFEWFSDHRDETPRDKLGRRLTQICAMDARPFKSRVSKLEQFERHYLLREINKAIVGFRPSPIISCEWGGLVPAPSSSTDFISEARMMAPRPIASGNWGCGAFGGHLQLKFVLQWIAASVCGRLERGEQQKQQQKPLGYELLYYTFGQHQLGQEIEAFVKAVQESGTVVDPQRLIECITHYPRRYPSGEIQRLREKTLLEYLATAIVHTSSSSSSSSSAVPA